MSKVIIGIHGLSNKPKAEELADGWKKAIIEGLEKNEGIKEEKARFDFRSVYWADVMYKTPDENADLYQPAAANALKTYEESWRDSLRADVFDAGGDVLEAIKNRIGVNTIADAIIKHKFQDLSRYYKEDAIRTKLISRLKDEILNSQGKRIMVVAHSMGTIIAYDVLRELGNEHPRLVIDHFITLGSPLGLPYVMHKISTTSAVIRTPSIVKKWTNFSDKRDPVAFDTHLSDDYKANDSGVTVKDDLVANDWAENRHKIYGYLRTPEVSRAIRNFI